MYAQVLENQFYPEIRNSKHFPLSQYTTRHKRFLSNEQFTSIKKTIKGTDRVCKLVKLSMQCCGQIL